MPRVGEAAAAARLRRVWGEGLEEAEDELLWQFCLVCPVRFCLRGTSDLGL